MTEIQKTAVTDSLTGPESLVGPTPEDITIYGNLIKAIDSGEDVGFAPRVNAEITFGLVDSATLGTFVNPSAPEQGLDQRTTRKLGQQRYIAGVLGLKVSDTKVDTATATFKAVIPELSEIPTIPAQDSAGHFLDTEGNPLRPIPRDMIFASRFLAQNSAHFSQPGAFEALAHRVTEQAESGQVIVKDKVGDPRGAMSLTRQVARVLGYEVDTFTKTEEGEYAMPVSGIRKGFDNRNTHFKSRGAVKPLDKV